VWLHYGMGLMFPLVIVSMSALAATSSAIAGQQPGTEKNQEQPPPIWKAGQSRSIELFPAGEVFPVYAADPHRPTNQLAISFYPTTEIPDTRSPRTMLAGGGRFGILRIDSSAPDGRAWQISIDAGLDAVFDSQNSNDGIGWDGNYGLTVTTAKTSSRFAFKVALLHVSAHLGDEYEERTQIDRINYTREEIAVAVSFRPRTRLRVYGELGTAYIMRSDQQQRMRWQIGGEYERHPTVFGGRMAWYGAVDFSLMEERDWRLDTCLQGGLVTRNKGRTIRMYVQWYDGRPTLGQFTTYSETAISLGLKLDL
jgi:Protein of unknown function (DUF1207)